MARNDYYTLQNYYGTIMQQVPVLLKYQFLCTFISGNDPLGDNVTINSPEFASLGNLTLICQSGNVPKHTLTTTDVNYFAKRFTMPATQTFEHNWQCRFLLTHDMAVYSDFRKLAMKFSSMRYQGGGIRNIPNINIQMDLLDQFSQKGHSVNEPPRFIMVGAFPTQIGKLDLGYTNAEANAMTFDVTWTYQYFYMDRIHDSGAQTADPLRYSPPIS